MLAFACGALAVSAMLRGGAFTAIALVAVAGLVHATTALWFAVLIGMALLVAHRELRPMLIAGAIAVVLAAAWAVTAGPLSGALVQIDPEWRALLETKDTLFAHRWPAGAWLVNLGTAAIWGWAWFERRRRGIASRADSGLAAGGLALLALFLATLPLAAMGMWLFVELQISRVFWLMDFMATVYLMSAIELRWQRPRVVRAIALALVAIAVARGIYILQVERAERALFAFAIPASPWKATMDWLARTPLDTHVLADPGHAWKYGASVRVAAGRDVFHEEVKDTAVAIYSRAVAERVLERSRALGRFEDLSPERARQLAAQYDVDYLVTEAQWPLPVMFTSPPFTVYDVR
jgi:hypothetical protein